MKIKILQIDFRTGQRRKCDACPVARGCLRAAKPLGYTSVTVHTCGMAVFRQSGNEMEGVRRYLPDSALEAIRRFDSYDAIPKSHFAPFEFEIDDLPRVS